MKVNVTFFADVVSLVDKTFVRSYPKRLKIRASTQVRIHSHYQRH